MTAKRKAYDTKSILNIDLIDYWNLKEHPLYFCLDSKSKPYIKIDEVPFPKSVKISSLQGISNYLRTSDWNFSDKRWDSMAKHIQGYLNVEFT